MNKRRFFIGVCIAVLLSSCSKKLIPDRPFLSNSEFRQDSLPLSELNIPVQINLKPLYSLAEKNVDTVFTSPNFPEDWVMSGCATRYKYQFRRGPVQFTGQNRSLHIGFTGYYRIIGSTRVCVGNTVITPWTPPCRCGYEEGERRVKVGFTSQVNVSPDYKVAISIKREEPVPLDKCSVCFFGADITDQVMNGLKEELDLARKSIEDSLGIIDMRNEVQQAWNLLSKPYDIYGMGWLEVNPESFSLQQVSAKNDSLSILFSISARPVIRLDKPREIKTLLPPLKQTATTSGFNIFLDAMLNYDSLSRILSSQFAGREFDFKKGLIKKKIRIRDCMIYGAGNERVILKISFTGSNSGVVYFTGIPVYDHTSGIFRIRDLDFDIKTKNFLAANADWLFNRRITSELETVSRFDLKPYADTAKSRIREYLNSEWNAGIKSYGEVDDLKIISFIPLPDKLIIRSQASGNFSIRINDPVFNFR